MEKARKVHRTRKPDIPLRTIKRLQSTSRYATRTRRRTSLPPRSGKMAPTCACSKPFVTLRNCSKSVRSPRGPPQCRWNLTGSNVHAPSLQTVRTPSNDAISEEPAHSFGLARISSVKY